MMGAYHLHNSHFSIISITSIDPMTFTFYAISVHHALSFHDKHCPKIENPNNPNNKQDKNLNQIKII